MNCFIPKNSKFKKYFLVTYKNISYKSYKLIFGDIGFKSILSGYLTSKQLVLIKKIFNKKLKKIGLFWIKVYPFFNITKKPSEVRMGKGKGNVYDWVCPIRIGQIVFEFKNINRKDINDLYKLCNNKLPLLFKIVTKY